ncbi:MAG TPA: TadE family protein [Pseudonocardiaceae bacterium]
MAWRWPVRLRGDRGSVSAELVIASPLLLFMVMAIVQFALWSHATHIAQAAAAQGLATARAQDATAAQGAAAARRLLDQLGHGPLTDARIDAARSGGAVMIRVSGDTTAVIPLLHLPVHAEATGPVERFIPDLSVDGK